MSTNKVTGAVDPVEFVALQVITLQAAIRALHACHPQPAKVETLYQQLIGQTQATAALLSTPESAAAFRRFAQDLLAQPIPPHTTR